MEARIPGFTYERMSVGEVTLNVASGGAGPPMVLLHGFPQTHLTWRHVATNLATEHQVICPDCVATVTATSPPPTLVG
jgi:haloacetate dehalogenase